MRDPFARSDYSAAPWPLFLNARDWAIVLRDMPTAVEATDEDGTVYRSVAGRSIVLYPTGLGDTGRMGTENVRRARRASVARRRLRSRVAARRPNRERQRLHRRLTRRWYWHRRPPYLYWSRRSSRSRYMASRVTRLIHATGGITRRYSPPGAVPWNRQ